MDRLDTRLDMGDLVQQVFNEISLERDPAIWQSSRQDAAMTEKRINFLAEFQETLFSKVSIKIYNTACICIVKYWHFRQSTEHKIYFSRSLI